MKVNSTAIDFRPNVSRVLNRPFIPTDPGRPNRVINRVLSFTEAEAEAQLASLRTEFDAGHPKAKRCYAWSFTEGKQTRFVTVLEIPPVESAQTAVRAAIAGEAKK